MDIESLQSFIMVVREKSISKAAQSLHVSQPTLSSRIHKLEQNLNFKLIERSWKGVELTREGKYFLPYAIESLHNISNVNTVLTSILSKEVKRTYQEVINNPDQLQIGIESWLAPCFIKFILEELKEMPEIKYKIITHPTPIIMELLELGVLDLGIFYGGKERIKQLSAPIIEDEMILLYSSKEREIKSDFSNMRYMI
ncbi:LysR family transcriptional regulator [Domibacillus tundrae]|uniref:LysR family transcriptional regulator n=1 Tax=Domibacillus tundrae TaxID=1587527 RepID=UPI0033980643